MGAFGDDLGAPFSFAGPLRRAHLLTTRKLVVVWPAAIVRPPGAAPLGVPFPCRYIPADANSGLCIGRSRADRRGLGGPSATNKLRRVYTDALLATTVSPTVSAYKKWLNIVRIGGILELH